MMNNKSNLFFCFLLSLLVLGGCHTHSAALRREVLARVGDDPEKRAAALYLLRHMQGHWSWHGGVQDAYLHMVDSLRPRMTSAKEMNRCMDTVSHRFSNQLARKRDETIISADDLSRNVEEAFTLWKNGRWARHLDFDAFCAYLLPYKVEEGQNLSPWRQRFAEMFREEGEEEDRLIDESRGEPLVATRNIFRAAQGSVLAYSDSVGRWELMDLRALSLLPYGDCFDLCNFALLLCRSRGIPVSLDYVPAWGDRAGSHAWLSVYTRRCVNRPVNAFEEGDLDEGIQCRGIAKVFRRTFVADREVSRRIRLGYPVPKGLEPPFFQDVTEEYVRCETVTAKTYALFPGGNLYAAVFTERGWSPVALGKRCGVGRVQFQKLGRGVLYLPVEVKRTGMQVPVGDPFYVHTNGKVEVFRSQPSFGEEVTVPLTLSRKYPLRHWFLWCHSDNLGCLTLAGNRSDFVGEQLVETLPCVPQCAGFVPLDSVQRFRYFRFCAVPGGACDLAEVKFYHGDSEIKPVRVWSTSSPRFAERVADDDALTFFPSDNRNTQEHEEWVAVDLGTPRRVTGIGYALRSDGNTFYPGYAYVLRRWDGMRWLPVETFTGTKDVAHHFQAVPSGTLLVVTCSATGHQSRPFMVSPEGQMQWL